MPRRRTLGRREGGCAATVRSRGPYRPGRYRPSAVGPVPRSPGWTSVRSSDWGPLDDATDREVHRHWLAPVIIGQHRRTAVCLVPRLTDNHVALDVGIIEPERADGGMPYQNADRTSMLTKRGGGHAKTICIAMYVAIPAKRPNASEVQ